MTDEQTYNDREVVQSDTVLPKPQIEIIVDGNSVFKPGMKTLFIDDYEETSSYFQSVVTGTYCSCDAVYLESYQVCSCDAVCTCENNCSCDGYSVPTTCSSNSSSGAWVSCGSPCSCVPVH